MEHFVEYPSSEESNGYDFSIAREREAALYNLVHHSHETYGSNETTIFNSDDYRMSQRSKVLRWKPIQPNNSSSSNCFGQLSNFVSYQEQDFMPLEDCNVNTIDFDEMRNRSFDSRDIFNNKKNKKQRKRKAKNFIRNLVSVNVEMRDGLGKRNSHMQTNFSTSNFSIKNSPRNKTNQGISLHPHGLKDAIEISQHCGLRGGCKESDVNANINQAMFDSSIKLSDIKEVYEINRKGNANCGEHFSKEPHKSEFTTIQDASNSINIVCSEINTSVSSCYAEKNNLTEVKEIVNISDSEDNSIVEVSVPPKPSPPLILLDSSDEAGSVTAVPDKPLLNVTPIVKPDVNINTNSNAECPGLLANQGHENNIINNLMSVNKTSKSNKKRKTKKKTTFKNADSIPWTDSMVMFYDQSWGGETFDHIQVQQSMSNNPQMWQILDIDKYGPPRERRPRVRCANCNQIGHLAPDCPDPKKIICCFMCGEQGHGEFRCPSKICLKCGRPGSFFNSGCPLCWSKDHPRNCTTCGDIEHFSWMCPNVWRQLHSVTSTEEVTSVNMQVPLLKPTRELSCCFCAGKGHTATQCPLLSRSSQSRSDTFVKPSYSASPNGRKRKKKRNSFEWKQRNEFYQKRRKTN